MDWNGRKARLEIAFDVTSYEEQRRALEITVQSENMLLECVKKLHRARVLEETVDEILADIGEYLDADRTYIFQIRDQLMFNTQEWCRKGVAPQIQNLQEMDVKLLDRWIPSFMNNSCVIIEDLETIKESSPDEYRELHVQGIHSLVAVPLEIKGKLLGYLGVDNPPKDKLENISNILNTLAYFLVTSLQRIEDEKEMRRLSYMDTLTGLYNRNRFIQDIESVEKKAETKPIGVVYVDINGLKEFNDRYGHAYGDEMIVKTVKLIMAAFPNECLYRDVYKRQGCRCRSSAPF